MGVPDRGEPASMEPAALATFIRQTFYPTVLTSSDLSFVNEQGLMPAGISVPAEELLFRLDRQEGRVRVAAGRAGLVGRPDDEADGRRAAEGFHAHPDALIYQRIGDERIALRQGSWIGGELIDFRAEGTAIPMLVYRINFANPAADRYSRLAIWQVRKTKAELDTAFRALAIGEFTDMRVVQRGASERPISTEIIGSSGGDRPGAAASHAVRPARQSVLVRHRAQCGRRGHRRDVLRARLGPRRRHVPGRRLRDGAGRRDLRGDPERISWTMESSCAGSIDPSEAPCQPGADWQPACQYLPFRHELESAVDEPLENGTSRTRMPPPAYQTLRYCSPRSKSDC